MFILTESKEMQIETIKFHAHLSPDKDFFKVNIQYC